MQKIFFSRPIPARVHLLRLIDRKFDVLSLENKLLYNTIERPYYGYGLLRAAELARRLGISRISAIEFGVAGGNGLLCLERHASRIKQATGIDVDVYGFDSGAGMPPPTDFRDLPYLWQEGYFAMDVNALEGKIQSSKLLIGPVEETIKTFTGQNNISPVGFISFDMDYYSSTKSALAIFNDIDVLLPRVVCYFDDVVGDINFAYSEFTGELLAIREFNSDNEDVKIAPVKGLRYWGNRTPELWHEQMYVAHCFGHPDYMKPTSDLNQLPLSPTA
jgi:hypothetical protein